MHILTNISSDHCHIRWAVCVLMAWTIWVLPAVGQTTSTQTEDQRFVSGLRERRLFRLAELQVQKRLASSELTNLERANLAIELIQTRTAAAIQSAGSEAEPQWQSALNLGQQFEQQFPDNPRILLVKVQTELARLTRGTFLSQQLAAGIAGKDLREQALQNINLARRGLEELVQETGNAIPYALNSSSQNTATLSAEQLRALQKRLRYQLAVCGLQTAKLYPADDQLNRLDSLSSVIKRLDEVARQTGPEMPLWWNLQIDRIHALRLLNRFDQASSELNKLSTKEILNTDQRRSDFLVQQIELVTGQGLGGAEQLIAASGQIQNRSAELDLAIVRLMMKAGATATDQTQTDRWQRAASELTKTIEDAHGRYYGRLAELAVIGEVGGNNSVAPETSTNLDILIRLGDEAWRKGQLDDAIKAFDKANQQAIADQNFDVAMSTGMKSAKILEQQKNLPAAGQRLIELGLTLKQNASAPQAHLVGCWHLAQAARTDATLTEQYAQQLQKHLEYWPTARSANQARVWLARYQSSQQDWQAAYKSLIGVDESSPHLAQAAALLPQIVHSDIKSKTSEITFPTTLGIEYSAQMLAKLKTAGVGPNDTWTRATRDWLLATIDINLSYAQSDREGVLDELTVMLTRAISESPDAEDTWKQSANAWRVALLATRKETILEATEAVSTLANGNPSVVAQCWSSLNDNLRSTAPNEQLAQLKLAVVEIALSDNSLSAADKNVWLGRKSKLLVDSGRGSEAITMLEGLVENNPRSLDLRIQLASALSNTKGQTEAALRNWRIVAKGVKPQTDNYFEAKYNIAKLLADSGNREGAKQLLEYMQIPPGWSNSKRSADFESLLNEVSN